MQTTGASSLAATTNPALTVYPNPARETIHVVATVIDASKLTLVSADGRVVYTQTWLAGAINSLLLNELTPGVYFLSLFDSTGNVVATQRFVLLP
jgi:hypothetical protein